MSRRYPVHHTGFTLGAINRDGAEDLFHVLGLHSAYLRFTELNFALLSMASLSLPWLRLT